MSEVEIGCVMVLCNLIISSALPNIHNFFNGSTKTLLSRTKYFRRKQNMRRYHQNMFSYFQRKIILDYKNIFFPVWLRNRLISDGLESVLSHTKKSYLA